MCPLTVRASIIFSIDAAAERHYKNGHGARSGLPRPNLAWSLCASRSSRHAIRVPMLTTWLQEASRLVFVFVKDAKPKRKVAVPVPDGYSWADFLQQVKSKLRIVGVKEVFLASVRVLEGHEGCARDSARQFTTTLNAVH